MIMRRGLDCDSISSERYYQRNHIPTLISGISQKSDFILTLCFVESLPAFDAEKKATPVHR